MIRTHPPRRYHRLGYGNYPRSYPHYYRRYYYYRGYNNYRFRTQPLRYILALNFLLFHLYLTRDNILNILPRHFYILLGKRSYP